MNNWKIFTEGLPNFDNDGFSKVGIPLDKFLNETKRSELDNYRVLYLIRTVAEKNIIKFGISDGAGCYRLNGYVSQARQHPTRVLGTPCQTNAFRKRAQAPSF